MPWLNAAANIRVVRPDIALAEVDGFLDRVGLTRLAAADPRQLSGDTAAVRVGADHFG